jgi:hypothetical protein
MSNTLSFDQISTVLNSIVSQATGKTALTATGTAAFVAQANTALSTGYDNVMKSISQVLDKTIFSTRPYNRKFGSLWKDNQQFGNHVRKLTMVDDDWENDQRLPLDDGTSVDQWNIKKGKVLQTNFYGGSVFQRHRTYFKDQLDVAFKSPEELGQFISMYTQNTMDMIEQAHESMSRGCVVNFIAGKIDGDSKNVIHLLTEYNNYSGTTFTADTIKQPANFPDFAKWAYARIATISSLLTERSQKYHINITGKEVSRHTPYRNQRLMLYASDMNHITTQVLSDIFNDKYMKMMQYEKVNFWQSIETPIGINAQPNYIDDTGAAKAATAPVEKDVFGVLFDEEAIGLTTINQWSMPTSMNAGGGYWNVYYHFTDRYYNDMTENAVVFLID